VGAILIHIWAARQGISTGYLDRLSPTLISGRWLALILSLPLGVALLSLGGVMVADPSRSLPSLLQLEPFQHPLQGLGFLFFILLFGPLPEELGWRGFVLEPLSQMVGLFWGTLVISLAWMVWHVPLFFISGYPLHEMDLGPVELVIYFFVLFPKSILFTWIWHHTGKSTLAAIMFHYAINLSGMVVDPGFLGECISGLIYTALALTVLILDTDPFFPSTRQET
jgi:membrane protease YdiL (CAAX protease family)